MGHWSLIVPFNIHQALPATPFVPGTRPEELRGIHVLPGVAQCSQIPQKQTQELVAVYQYRKEKRSISGYPRGAYRKIILGASLVAQMVNNLPATQETWVLSLK